MAEVKFKRKSTSEIQDLPVDDGSFIVDYESGSAYIDYQTDRVQISGGGASGGDAIPVGLEAEYTGSTAPEGWEEVDEKAEILWTNSSPSSNFAGQTINNLNLSNYDSYRIIWATSTSGIIKQSTGLIPTGERTEFFTCFYNNGVSVRYRQISAITSSSISFADATENGNTNNGACIPIYIIGYKTGLFS